MRYFALITTAMFVFTNTAFAQVQTEDSLPDANPSVEMDVAPPEAVEEVLEEGMDIEEPALSDSIEATPSEPNLDPGFDELTEPALETMDMEPVTDMMSGPLQDELSEPLTDGPDHSALEKPDLAESLSANPELSTLTAAVESAGLTETLQGEGPFTVFAPTNEGFEAVSEEKREMLGQPENKDMLSDILTYHVVSGSIDAETLLDNIEAEGGNYNMETVNGGFLTAILADGDIYILDSASRIAKVEQTDIEASNGLVHVINMVALPKANQD